MWFPFIFPTHKNPPSSLCCFLEFPRQQKKKWRLQLRRRTLKAPKTCTASEASKWSSRTSRTRPRWRSWAGSSPLSIELRGTATATRCSNLPPEPGSLSLFCARSSLGSRAIRPRTCTPISRIPSPTPRPWPTPRATEAALFQKRHLQVSAIAYGFNLSAQVLILFRN